MSYNGSGIFEINSFGQPVIPGTLIEGSVFNLFAQDIALGLSTVITRDGQSATTSRIPFAFGINSSLVDNAVSANTGSIIAQGGIGVAKDIWCAGVVRGVGGVVMPNPANTHTWTAKTDAANKLSFSYDLGTPALELNIDNSALFYGDFNVNNKFTVAAASGNTVVAGTLNSGLLTVTGTTSGSVAIIGGNAANAAYVAAITASGNSSYVGREGSTPAFGALANEMFLYNGGLGLKMTYGVTPAVTIPGTLGVTGQITSNADRMAITPTTNTLAAFTQYTNIHGSGYIGIESNAGASLLPGTSGGALTLVAPGTTREMFFGTNNAVRMIIDAVGAVTIPGTLAVTGNSGFGRAPAASQIIAATCTTSDYIMGLVNSHPTQPNGIAVTYSAAAPNGTSNFFFKAADTGATRIELRSNGGIANFSGNNANLSDSRTKKDWAALPSYWAKWKAIEFGTFLYKDQTDSFTNIGVLAQQVEKVAPELVDTSGFGDVPADGVPLKAIWQTDMFMAMGKVVQECQERIAALEARTPSGLF